MCLTYCPHPPTLVQQHDFKSHNWFRIYGNVQQGVSTVLVWIKQSYLFKYYTFFQLGIFAFFFYYYICLTLLIKCFLQWTKNCASVNGSLRFGRRTSYIGQQSNRATWRPSGGQSSDISQTTLLSGVEIESSEHPSSFLVNSEFSRFRKYVQPH